jgi:replicative DNA helicase
MISTDVVFSQIIYNKNYMTKVLPHLKVDYFDKDSDKIVYKLIGSYISKYKKIPNKKALIAEAYSKNLNNDLTSSVVDTLTKLENEPYDEEWLFDKTEEFCKEKALYNALYKSVELAEGEERGNIPEILQKALAVSFDTSVGHDFFRDDRYEYYHKKTHKIPFRSKTFNDITDDGLERKTIACVMGPTGKGKSINLCNFAADYLKDGLNVLYITLEMSEIAVAARIEQNLMELTKEEVKSLSRSEYRKKLKNAQERSGELLIKEYPSTSVHTGHFRHLIHELETKKGIKPDVIMVDYLGICNSERVKFKQNSFDYLKAVSEELRSLAVETNTLVWTAMQTNRDGAKNENYDETNVSESWGVVYTFDFFIGFKRNEDLDKQNKIIFTQFKNRNVDESLMKSFAMGINRSKMLLYDLGDEDEGDDLVQKFDNIPDKEKFKSIFKT